MFKFLNVSKKSAQQCVRVSVASQSLLTLDTLLAILAGHSSTLAWKIPWTEEPGGLQSMGSLGVGHD